MKALVVVIVGGVRQPAVVVDDALVFQAYDPVDASADPTVRRGGLVAPRLEWHAVREGPRATKIRRHA